MGRLSKLFPREAIRIHGMRKVWSLVLKWLTRVLPFCLWCWLSCKLIYAYFYHNILVVVQSLGNVWLFAAPWPVACQASLSFTISWSFLRLMSIESTIPSNHLILSCPLLLLPLIFPSIRVFSNELALYIRWLKYWSFSFSINHPCNLYTELISFRMDWCDLLAAQGTLKSLLQHHSSKASIHWHSAFFTVQHSHAYMRTGKTIALTIWTFVGKVMSLLFNMLSRFVIAFLPRSKHLLISRLQSSSIVILEPKKIKSVTLSIVSSSIYHEVKGPDTWLLSFECGVLS